MAKCPELKPKKFETGWELVLKNVYNFIIGKLIYIYIYPLLVKHLG